VSALALPRRGAFGCSTGTGRILPERCAIVRVRWCGGARSSGTSAFLNVVEHSTAVGRRADLLRHASIGSNDPKRSLAWAARQRIGGLQNVILVVSSGIPISAWLRELGLERYVDAFQDNAVDARSSPHLTAEDLTEMGVTAIGHRRLLLKAIGQREASLPGLVPRRKQLLRRRSCLCAASEIITPGARLSATIRAFASALHRRRPNAPVITSRTSGSTLRPNADVK